MWHINRLDEISSTTFYAILKLRIDTFVVAQKRIYHELDQHDLEAFHVYYVNEETAEIEAYARVFQVGDHVTFGRVVTAQNYRGTGHGKELVAEIIQFCQLHWPDLPIVIESRCQVEPFYERFGFKRYGDPFIFESTPHIEMRRENEKMV